MFNNYYSELITIIENSDKFTAAILLILGKIFSGIFFIPGTPLTLLSGIMLGTFWGSTIAIIGNTIGATIGFLISRYFLFNYVQNKILPKYKKIKEFENHMTINGFQTVLFLRLIPLFPFNVLNFILGITNISFKNYFLGTLIGIIPGTIAFVYLGESFKMLSIFNITTAILGIVGLSYIGKFWKLK